MAATTPAPPKTNRLGLDRTGLSRRQDHAVRRLRPQRNLRAHHRRLLRNGHAARACCEAEGNWLLVKEPSVFHVPVAQLQSVHGRMPSVTTGAVLANRSLMASESVATATLPPSALGQFVHLMRRNLPMIYIIEDNGVYGLTKGQFSATADLGSKLKTGVINELPPIDTCALAISLGATFVGRSFSGDKRQLHAMLKAAIAHRGP